MKKVDTVLFDFDGTVMDTTEVIVKSWQHTFKTLEGETRPLSEIYPTFGEPLWITMERFFPNHPVEKSIEIYRSYHYDNFGDLIKVFPGMEDLLKVLQTEGYIMGLVTSRLRATTTQGLEAYGLGSYFDTILTCEDTDKHKPDPAPINLTLERLGKTSEKALMVGDTMFDILCARNAGVKSVLVDWAVAVDEEARTGENSPDYIIKAPIEIKHILEKINDEQK